MSRLSVRIIEARNLKSADLNGSSDPFAEVRIKNQSQHFKTKTLRHNLAPFWNEQFFLQPTNPAQDVILIKIYDYDTITNNDLLGEVEIPVSFYFNRPGMEEWRQLTRRHGYSMVPGEVKIMINFEGAQIIAPQQGYPQQGVYPQANVGYTAPGQVYANQPQNPYPQPPAQLPAQHSPMGYVLPAVGAAAVSAAVVGGVAYGMHHHQQQQQQQQFNAQQAQMAAQIQTQQQYQGAYPTAYPSAYPTQFAPVQTYAPMQTYPPPMQTAYAPVQTYPPAYGAQPMYPQMATYGQLPQNVTYVSVPVQYVPVQYQYPTMYIPGQPFVVPMGIPPHIAQKMMHASHMFRRFDTNYSGSLSKKEWKRAMWSMGYYMSKHDAKRLFYMIDTNHSGGISEREFCEYWVATH